MLKKRSLDSMCESCAFPRILDPKTRHSDLRPISLSAVSEARTAPQLPSGAGLGRNRPNSNFPESDFGTRPCWDSYHAGGHTCTNLNQAENAIRNIVALDFNCASVPVHLEQHLRALIWMVDAEIDQMLNSLRRVCAFAAGARLDKPQRQNG